MLKAILFFATFSVSLTLWAQNNLSGRPTMSPFRSGEARFELDLPKDFAIQSVQYVLHAEDGKPLSTPVTWKDGTVQHLGDKVYVMFPIKLEPGKYKVHLKASAKEVKQGQRNVQIPFSVDKAVTVKDPGEEGKKTLAGIDSDGDGVRDDIQVWIDNKYPESKYPSTNKGLKQYSREALKTLLVYQDYQKTREYGENLNRAIACLGWVMGGLESHRKVKMHDSILLNTIERVKADMIQQKHFHGISAPEDVTATPLNRKFIFCNFSAEKEIIN